MQECTGGKFSIAVESSVRNENFMNSKRIEMTVQNNPSLFGLKNSNRDFTIKESWGKNQFNSSFPAALCCYLDYKDLKANYLKIKEGIYVHGELAINEAFGIEPNSVDAYYAFKSTYAPFQQYVEPLWLFKKRVLGSVWQELK